MSAILGVYRRDDNLADRSDLQRMSAVLAHRGEQEGMWLGRSVGLGWRLIGAAPGLALPTLPAAGLSISADARIDNRSELSAALGLAVDGSPSGDSLLILAAYEHWGERCVEHLLGDFAFAIWDERRQQLFCARDHAGVKPFYYFQSERLFAFASESRGLLCLEAVPCRINETRIGEYLAQLEDDCSTTFYRDILRLPPAHTLLVRADSVRVSRYWSLDPTRELRLASDAAYAEAFRAHFQEAVRCRMHGSLPLGSMLSGGLDSSSITCVARDLLAASGGLPLATFSTVFDKLTVCDERVFINAVLSQGGFQPSFMSGDRYSPLALSGKSGWQLEEPHPGPGLFLQQRQLEVARARGIRVMLDGSGGDEVVSQGLERLGALARSGQWWTLAREIRGVAAIYGASPVQEFWEYAWFYRLRPALDRSLAGRTLHRYLRKTQRQLAAFSGAAARPPGWFVALNPRFVTGLGLGARQREHVDQAESDERQLHYEVLIGSLQPLALETLDQAAALAGVEVRYPFWDRRLVEFCLALPATQKLRDGWNRLVLRNAMAGILPLSVQWRKTKLDFTPNLVHVLLTYDRPELDRLLIHEAHYLDPYFNLPDLQNIYQQFIASAGHVHPFYIQLLWRAASLGRWLQSLDRSPVQVAHSPWLLAHNY